MYRATIQLDAVAVDVDEIRDVLDGHSPQIAQMADGRFLVVLLVEAASLAQAAQRALGLMTHATEVPPVALRIDPA